MADRSGAPETGQAAPARPRNRSRQALALGVAALVGWAFLALSDGGIDPGDGLGGAGPRGAFLALALGAPLAGAALLLAWDRAALRAAPSRLALAGAGGVVAWSALTIAWAAAPDLAWIEANRLAIAFCALLIGLCVGALVPASPRLLALGLSAAALPALLVGLGSKVLPSVLGEDGELARLSTPVGYWNGLALVAVMAVPGLLWTAGGTRARRGGLPLAAAGLALVLTTIVLTYSRGGILALAMAVAISLAFVPRRAPALAALIAGALAAALPAAHALTDQALKTDRLPTALREDAGAGLGVRIAIGLAAAALLAPAIVRLARRAGVDRRRARRVAVAGGLAVLLAAGVGVATSAGARDWAGDRVAEFRGEGGDAVANDPGRLVNAAGNQRRGWWGEAWRGFQDAPVIGQGAGGFPLVHLQERRVGDDTFNTREAHGAVPSIMSGTGLVGLGLLTALIAGVGWGVLRASVRHTGPEIGLPLAIVAAFALSAAVDWSLSIPAVSVPAFAAAGVVLAAAAPGSCGGRSRPGAWAAAALAAACLVAILSAALPWWSGHLTGAGEDSLAANRPAEARDRANAARAANPLATAPLLLLASAYSDLGDPARALGAYQEATRLQPDNPLTWRALAIFLGRDPSAAAAWSEVRRLDPQDPEAALRAG